MLFPWVSDVFACLIEIQPTILYFEVQGTDVLIQLMALSS